MSRAKCGTRGSEWGSVFRVVTPPPPKIKEAWLLFDDFRTLDATYIKRFQTHDEMEKWIRTNGDKTKTYRAQHIVNDKLQRFDEDWVMQPNLYMPFIEQWQFFGDCRHGWVRYDFRIRDEFDMAMEWGRYGKRRLVPNPIGETPDEIFERWKERRNDPRFRDIKLQEQKHTPLIPDIFGNRPSSKEREACIAEYEKAGIPYDEMPPFVQGPWIGGIPLINSGSSESNEKWPRLIDDKLRDELNKQGNYVPSPKSKPRDLDENPDNKETLSPKQKPNPKIKPTIAKWKTATGCPLAVENDLTGELGTKKVGDGWELFDDMNLRVHIAKSRDNLQKWLRHRGNRDQTYRSRHIVDGKSQMYDEGWWKFQAGGVYSNSEWTFTELCNETKDSKCLAGRFDRTK